MHLHSDHEVCCQAVVTSLWSSDEQGAPDQVSSGMVLKESQSKPEFLGQVVTADVLGKMITTLPLSAVTTMVCLHFLRVKNEAGFQRYLDVDQPCHEE